MSKEDTEKNLNKFCLLLKYYENTANGLLGGESVYFNQQFFYGIPSGLAHAASKISNDKSYMNTTGLFDQIVAKLLASYADRTPGMISQYCGGRHPHVDDLYQAAKKNRDQNPKPLFFESVGINNEPPRVKKANR